jgi:hypothetical protein
MYYNPDAYVTTFNQIAENRAKGMSEENLKDEAHTIATVSVKKFEDCMEITNTISFIFKLSNSIKNAPTIRQICLTTRHQQLRVEFSCMPMTGEEVPMYSLEEFFKQFGDGSKQQKKIQKDIQKKIDILSKELSITNDLLSELNRIWSEEIWRGPSNYYNSVKFRLIEGLTKEEGEDTEYIAQKFIVGLNLKKFYK